MKDPVGAMSTGVLRVTVAGEPIIEHTAGTTERSSGERCTPGTRFQIASVSKQFTATAIIALAREGHLSVDDHVARWFPGGPHGWAEITVHHLLTHTSGLGQWEDFPEIDIFTAMNASRMLGVLQAHPLLSAPGAGFYYSSPGYWLLAQIAEKVSEQPYAQFLRKEVLEPAGLADTFAGSAEQRLHVASGHTDGEAVASYELDHTGKGAGDIYSTARDLDRWNRSLQSLLSADRWWRTMFARHAAAGQSLGTWSTDDAYGYGWYLHHHGQITLHYHSGHNSGFNSFSAWVPQKQLSFVILINDDAIDPQAIARALVHAELGLLAS
jgi:CubicO group peptidase (beta-lactamase class C family)